MRSTTFAVFTILVLYVGLVFAKEPSPLSGVPWPATDGLERSLPMADEVGPPRADRFVGIFYFLWHSAPAGKSPHWDGPYDISKILRQEPDALSNPDSLLWGRVGQYHYRPRSRQRSRLLRERGCGSGGAVQLSTRGHG